MEENKVKDLLQWVLRTGIPFPQSIENSQVILIANGIFYGLFILRHMALIPNLREFQKIFVVDTRDTFRRIFKEEMRARLWVILKILSHPILL